MIAATSGKRVPHPAARLLAPSLIFLFLALLSLEVVWSGIVSYYAVENPADALRLDPANAAAVISVADEDRQGAVSEGKTIDSEAMRSRVEKALARDPLNAAGIRLLGQLSDEPTAEKLMERAVDLSKREAIAIGWLADHKRVAHDYASSMDYVDLLLRGQPSFVPVLADLLTEMMEVRETQPAIFGVLASNPPWATQFLPLAMQRVHDPETVIALATQYQNNGTELSAEVRSGYVHRLVAEARYDLAYDTWRRLLTPQQLQRLDTLFDGDFQFAPSGGEFEWTIQGGQNVTISTGETRSEAGTRALKLDYSGGLTTPHSVLQGFQAPPGKYRFSGKMSGSLIGRRGHEWRVICFTTGAVIGQSSPLHGSVSGWQDFDFTFSVPDKGCSLQRAQLILDSRAASEKFVSGSISYRQLAVRPQQ